MDGEDRERRKEMDRWFWAFGSGGRMCIGSNLAMYRKSSDVFFFQVCVGARSAGLLWLKLLASFLAFAPVSSSDSQRDAQGEKCIVSTIVLLVRTLDEHSREMKYIVATIYSNYTTTIVDDTGIEQVDAYTAPPKNEKLIIRLERV